MTRICISPVTAVTCNDAFETIENATIHIEEGRITYVGPAQSAPEFQADETLGGEHIVAMPGLVNTHTHAAMTLLRGYADDMALEPWLQTRIWPFEANLTPDDVIIGLQLALCEMLRGGTTCMADMYFHYEQSTPVLIESGMRACPSAVLLGFLPEAEKRIANGKAWVRNFQNASDGRITPFFGPHSLYTCNREQWKSIVEAAHELGAPIHTHASETLREVADVTAQWGANPIQTLKNIGAMDGALHLAHCVHVDEHDIATMAENNAKNGCTFSVAHNPTSNLKLASGFAPVPAMLESGITIGLGPDGTASNNDLDMWEEMRLAALIHKATTGDATTVSAQQALLMATRNGARSLSLGEVTGSLEVGKKADIVLVDFDKPHLYPRHNPVSHLVYSAKASDVSATIVDGKILFRDGELTTLDEKRICAEAETTARRLVKLASE
ncbi:MAG TPA: amidohydrolase [Abditibacteriaceae bacterium]